MFTHPEAVLKKMLSHRDYDTVRDGVLTVSAYANFYPVAYKKNGHLQGLDVDIIKGFAKWADLDVKFIEKKKFDGIWKDITSKSDICIGGIGMTDQRTLASTEWTMPYFFVDRTVVYNLKDPLTRFPEDVTGLILGTKGSTGWIDGKQKMTRARLTKLMKPGTTDDQDISKLLKGQIQGLMRGSFVGKALVNKYPNQLGMVKPWKIDPELVVSDGEVFAFPTNKNSGIAPAMNSYLTYLLLSGKLKKLLVKYHLI
jgi:membrane-bound lytic murein transglycosylase MltF